MPLHLQNYFLARTLSAGEMKVSVKTDHNGPTVGHEAISGPADCGVWLLVSEDYAMGLMFRYFNFARVNEGKELLFSF